MNWARPELLWLLPGVCLAVTASHLVRERRRRRLLAALGAAPHAGPEAVRTGLVMMAIALVGAGEAVATRVSAGDVDVTYRTPLEQRWGPRRFLIFYLVCGVGGGLMTLLTIVTVRREDGGVRPRGTPPGHYTWERLPCSIAPSTLTLVLLLGMLSGLVSWTCFTRASTAFTSSGLAA